MQYSKIIVAAISLALAEARISFTTLPNAVEAGEAVQLKWTGGNNGPVTITLKKGDSDDLQTVDVLTGNAQGNSYTWTPSSDLSDGDDYALQISQGVDEVNYTGQFSLSGGSDNDDDTSSSSGYPTSSFASASASTTVETTVTSANSTSSRSHTVYVTGTAPIVPSASGTGINVTRNTTFSSATPTRSQSGGLTASTTGEATTTSDSDDAAATTSGSAEPSSGAASHMEIQIGAGIAAMVGLVALL